MKLSFFSVLILVCLFLIGCADSTNETDDDFPPSMTGTVMIDDQDYEMEKGGYAWEREQGSNIEVVQTDAASPNQIAEEMEPISVEANQTVDIEIEENPDIQVYLWNANELDKEIEHDSNQMKVPEKEGEYIYEVKAEWENGKNSYTYVVNVR